MKKILYSVFAMILFVACNTQVIEKPDNLIEEGKMTDILYDLALLDAIKSQNSFSIPNASINPKAYIYKKYQVDSIQFAQSNQYYVSQMEEYKKMYDQVSERLNKEKTAAEGGNKSTGTSNPSPAADAPQIQ